MFFIMKLYIFVFLFIFTSFVSGVDYVIKTTWDNQTIDHIDRPVVISLDRYDSNTFKVTVNGPFYQGKGPNGYVGEPLYGLWDYEVVGLFFSNDQNQYIEIELCPKGQHLILLFDGYRKMIRHSLLMEYQAKVNKTEKTWQGVAIVPVVYLPPNITRMNAYAIHGTEPNRIYESLYPVPTDSSAKPDLHKLEFFESFDRHIILSQGTSDVVHLSSVWTDSLQGIRSFTIAHTWNGTLLEPEDQVHLKLSIEANISLILKVDAPFYNDEPSTPDEPGPNPFLYNYEVVHLFLMNPDRTYLEIELGPFGGYLLALQPFWNGSMNQDQYPIVFSVDRQANNRWNGTAIIPIAYLPPRVNACNAGSKNGVGNFRQHTSLYLSSPNAYDEPWTHFNPQILNFKAIDLSVIYPANENGIYSYVWQQAASGLFSNNQAAESFSKNILFLLMLTGFVSLMPSMLY